MLSAPSMCVVSQNAYHTLTLYFLPPLLLLYPEHFPLCHLFLIAEKGTIVSLNQHKYFQLFLI